MTGQGCSLDVRLKEEKEKRGFFLFLCFFFWVNLILFGIFTARLNHALSKLHLGRVE